MTQLSDRLARLSPQQRQLLERRMRKLDRQPPAGGEPSRLAGEDLESALAFWRGVLRDLPAERGLAVRPAAAAGEAAGRRCVSLPPSLAVRVDSLARRLGVSSPRLSVALLAALLYRYTGRARQVIGCPFVLAGGAEVLPVAVDAGGDLSFSGLVRRVETAARQVEAGGLLPLSQLVAGAEAAALLRPGESLLPVAVAPAAAAPAAAAGRELLFRLEETGGEIVYDLARLDPACAAGVVLHLAELLSAAAAHPERSLTELDLYGGTLHGRFHTGAIAVASAAAAPTFPEGFAEQVRRAPGLAAVASGGETVTYREIDERSNRLARHLLRRGLLPEDRVGLWLPRSTALVVALLAVIKAGGTAVPIDDQEGPARLADAAAETGMRWLVSEARPPATGSRGPAWLPIDPRASAVAQESAAPVSLPVHREAVALVVPGLSPPGGRRWVLLTQASLARLLGDLDAEIACGPGDALPVLSSPASHGLVVEVLWPLARGARVVLGAAAPERTPRRAGAAARKPISFSLFYFASAETRRGDRWRLLFEGAKFADRHGFEAVWTPERHFHPFGGLFPNAGVTSAALAMLTERVQLRAGSVVLPLHDPIRVAEDWSLVDNYSRGRVGIAFASGWHADDFVFFPDNYADRREVMWRGIETVRRLWRGEAVPARGGLGKELAVRIYPRPVQPELPIWITAAASSDTVLRAGGAGANLLANLLSQNPDGLARKVRQYRAARADGGHDPGAGRFTLMLHTFVADDLDVVRETVRAPFCDYIRSFGGLLQNFVRNTRRGEEARALSDDDQEQVLAFAFERYFRDSALFGTPRSCMELLRLLEDTGVDEVACLIDFGVEVETALAGLYQLERLRELATRSSPPPAPAPAAAREVSLVCAGTPEPAELAALIGAGSPRAVLLDSRTPFAASPTGRASQVIRFRGDAETAGWSSVLERGAAAGLPPLLRPLSGLQLLVLRGGCEPPPIGVPGELCVQGEGLARGYQGRPDQTALRFVPSPFGARPGERLYRTGHAARVLPEGGLEWIGLYGERGKVVPLRSAAAGAGATGGAVEPGRRTEEPV